MRRLIFNALPALAATAALAACSVGPDFLAPEGPKTQTYLPDQKTNLIAAGIPGGEAQRIVQSMDIPGQWWGVFRSPQLNGLIERSLMANPDIRAAAASLKVAQLNARAQRATLFPTISAGFAGSQNQTATILQTPLADQEMTIFGLFTAGLQITYALDIWGGNRRQIESLDALAEAQCFQLEGAYLSLASNVVAAAIVEAALRAQVESTKRIIAAQRETLGILTQQSGLGAIPGADVATQQAALAQSEATLPPLQKALAQQRNLLANLTGRLPSDAAVERFELADLKLPAELPLSLPSKLVEQRPDVRAAEANLHSASALVGVAIANQLPQITLSASVTANSISLGSLFGSGLAGTVAGFNVAQTVLDGGALSAKKKGAQAALEQADAQYQSIVLAAFRNVADTLNALEYDALTLKAAVEAERAAATSLNIARRRLELGDTTYVFVLIAELTYQQAILTRIQAQAARLTNTAALFQSLGGGWWNRDAAPAVNGRSTCRPPATTPTAAPLQAAAPSVRP